MRTFVYVDGFNLYYGALKGTPWKWLDPVALLERVLQPNHRILTVKYFTARVSGTSGRMACSIRNCPIRSPAPTSENPWPGSNETECEFCLRMSG